MKVTIVAVNRKERMSNRTGKPFTSLGIRTQEHGEKWLSGFGNKDNSTWKNGDVVEIDIEQKGEYLNFTVPKKADMGPAANNAATAEIKNILTIGVITRLDKILSWIERQEYIAEHGEAPEPEYPEQDETNDARDL